MCGVAGVLWDSKAHAGVVERSIAELRHRGPDGSAVKTLGRATLGHARLSIIDLSSGDQPMSNEDSTVWVTFNGEIFNYIELRQELTKHGHVFRTSSDTETIVHAYEQWGDDFVSHLNGQFAFAIWDLVRQRMLLVRDRVGIRPLFYRALRSGLHFASEVKALAIDEAPLEIDPRGLAQVFALWSTVGERTVFKDVMSVPPGCMLICEGGRRRLERYWSWKFPDSAGVRSVSMQDAAAEIRELLSDAVRLQLRADVPVGAYLSGGLDSSGIVALVRSDRSIHLRTFSVAFQNSEFDESVHQLELARVFGTEHSVVQCGPTDIADIFPRLIWHTETPILRTGPAPLMMLSRLVRDSGFKVVLSGEGADEVFGGYDLFKEARIRRFWASQPKSNMRPALFARLYPYLRNSPVTNRAFTRSFFGEGLLQTESPFYGHVTRWSSARRTWAFLSEDVKQALQGWSPEADLADNLPSGFSGWEGLSRDQYVEANTLLYGYLLSSQGDRVAMANSVEGRVPYLDHRVIELANALPAKLKLRGLREKAVLREALRPLVPSATADRVKQPYRAPDAASFFADGKCPDYVSRQLSVERISEAGLFSPVATTRLFEKCRTGKAIGFADNMAFVGILSAMLLDDLFVRRRTTNSVK